MQKLCINILIALSIVLFTLETRGSEAEQPLSSSVVSATSIDIDGNNEFDALTDGLLILRSMFGLSGSALVSGAISANSLYSEPEDIEYRITSLGNRLDIDDNGNIDALTDGLIILRYLFGLSGGTLVDGVIASNAQRLIPSEIETYLNTLDQPRNSTEPPNGQKLTLASINLSYDDIIAQTATDNAVASREMSPILRLKEFIVDHANRYSFFTRAYADIYPPVQTYAEFIASKKYVDGALFSLDPIVVYYERDEVGDIALDDNGEPIVLEVECDLSFAEIRVNKVFLLNEKTKDFLSLVTVPDSVNEDCVLEFREALLVVKNTGETFEITGVDGGLSDVMPAQTPGHNSSDEALLVIGDQIYSLEIKSDNTIILTQLTSPGAQVSIYTGGVRFAGAFAYDGQYLLGASSGAVASTATFFIYEKGTTAFRILRPQEYDTNIYLSVLLDDQGSFLFHYASSPFYVLNMEDLTYVSHLDYLGVVPIGGDDVAPVYEPLCDGSVIGGCTLSYEGMSIFGAAGRYEKWIVGDRATAWNYESFENTGSILCMPDFMMNGICDPTYMSLVGSELYAVDKNKTVYARYDLETKIGTFVNLDDSGYLATDFEVFKDLAMVVVTDSSNSDKLYVEVNLLTGVVINRGVIYEGSRKVVEFLPIGG